MNNTSYGRELPGFNMNEGVHDLHIFQQQILEGVPRQSFSQVHHLNQNGTLELSPYLVPRAHVHLPDHHENQNQNIKNP